MLTEPHGRRLRRVLHTPPRIDAVGQLAALRSCTGDAPLDITTGRASATTLHVNRRQP